MATEMRQVYKCEVCGNIVVVTHAGAGELVCCGQPMKLFKENTVDAAKEKHVPVITVDGDKVTVNVGAVPHPMEEKHWIEWIELTAGKDIYIRMLKPGDEPKATFCLCGKDLTNLKAREYCNLHGLWASA
ncbi:MAG: desulfoferrodoxin [Desulfovibrionaceae bacterium]